MNIHARLVHAQAFAAQVRNGIGGTVVANPDFTAQTNGTTSFVDGAGRVTEGSSSNAWIVTRDGKVVTRHADHAILRGITRSVVLPPALRRVWPAMATSFLPCLAMSCCAARMARESATASGRRSTSRPPRTPMCWRTAARGCPSATAARLIASRKSGTETKWEQEQETR